MQEYKREKTTLESQLKDVQKKSLDHDDHLRVIDAWWSQVATYNNLQRFYDSADVAQLLDEVRLLAEDELPDTGADSQYIQTNPLTFQTNFFKFPSQPQSNSRVARTSRHTWQRRARKSSPNYKIFSPTCQVRVASNHPVFKTSRPNSQSYLHPKKNTQSNSIDCERRKMSLANASKPHLCDTSRQKSDSIEPSLRPQQNQNNKQLLELGTMQAVVLVVWRMLK